MPAPDTATLTNLWHRLAMWIRLGLAPDDPRLIARYLSCGRTLHEIHGRPDWQVTERMLRLLIDTAEDGALPLVWRLSCLDACCGPIHHLGALTGSCPDKAVRLGELAQRFSRFDFGATGAARRTH